MVSWQTLFTQSITSVAELLNILDLDPALAFDLPAFPLRVPRGFVARMEKGNIHDPLLRQVLPLQKELVRMPEFMADPLREAEANPVPGILHKYHGRALMMVSSRCAINCRYCFRREFAYDDNRIMGESMEYIKKDTSLREIILSGGDPLMISDRRFKELIENLSDISHIKTFRIHSRMPIVLPERMTSHFISTLADTRLRSVLVLHTNHPKEIDPSVETAIKKIRKENITLLNQSVLLKGINDSAETLIDLSERLFDMGVLPYYLHLLDKVSGTSHFDVSEAVAKALVRTMQEKLPGYLLPTLVREIPGLKSKTPL